MQDDRYTVEMIINPDQPSLSYWMFDTLAEAQQFFHVLKRGMTAYTITLHLTDTDGRTELECVRMGDEENAAVPVKEVDYRQVLRSLSKPSMIIDDIDHLLS